MSTEGTLLVAVEDMATVGVVAAGAAHFAMDQGASRVILLHVLDEHIIANGLAGLIGGAAPLQATSEEASAILALAEATLKAEYRGMNMPPPVVVQQIREGRPGATIARTAAEMGAIAIVVGARRPHAFGRLSHADAVDYLRRHTAVPVQVIALQADASSSSGTPA